MGTSLELELSLIAHVGFRLSPPSSRRPNSSHSDQTLSSGDGSPVRKPRPRSIAGRLPSYMSSTASSEARLGRNRNVKLTGKIKQFTAATPPRASNFIHSKLFCSLTPQRPIPSFFRNLLRAQLLITIKYLQIFIALPNQKKSLNYQPTQI